MVTPLKKVTKVVKRRKTFPRHYSDRFERLNYGTWRKPKGQHAARTAQLTSHSPSTAASTAQQRDMYSTVVVGGAAVGAAAEE